MALYKYVTPCRIDILQHGLISFTPPSRLNDAFEMSPYVGEFLGYLQVRNILEEIIKRVQNNITEDELDQITSDIYRKMEKQIVPDARKEFYERINAEYGVLCLTDRPDNLLMWSHYSLAHEGFVIEFDEQHPFFNHKSHIPGVGFLEKVKYSRCRPHFDSIHDIKPAQTFFTKSEDWQYEKEWRIVRQLKEAKKITRPNGIKVYLFEIPTECIKRIIFGSKMSSKVMMDLKINAERHACIKFSRAQISDETYNLDITDF